MPGDPKALTVPAALSDLKYLKELQNRNNDRDSRADEFEAIATAVAAAIKKIESLQSSRIGGSEYVLVNGLDAYSFYQGVSFALARVGAVIRGTDVSS